MTAKPLIGISGSHMIDGGGQFPGYHRSYVNHDYVRSVTERAVSPSSFLSMKRMMSWKPYGRVDGLLLSGGHDVYPLLYGEEPCRQIGAVWPERDHFDMLLLKRAEARKIPVVGICRGLQIINVAHGGTLYQDLSKDPQSFVKHSQNQDPATATHTIEIDPQSRLASLLGRTEWVTNSHHHQTVHEVGQGPLVTARAKDGTVESAGYGGKLSHGLSVHPEMMSIHSKLARNLFVDFVKEAEVRHGNR